MHRFACSYSEAEHSNIFLRPNEIPEIGQAVTTGEQPRKFPTEKGKKFVGNKIIPVLLHLTTHTMCRIKRYNPQISFLELFIYIKNETKMFYNFQNQCFGFVKCIRSIDRFLHLICVSVVSTGILVCILTMLVLRYNKLSANFHQQLPKKADLIWNHLIRSSIYLVPGSGSAIRLRI
jgi:hypothetical protein